MQQMKIECIFCEKDMSDQKWKEDYSLIAWRDDPEDPESMNKVAKCGHNSCFKSFLELNNLIIK
jgi:hypothetical protein